jgi:hypothetical protein
MSQKSCKYWPHSDNLVCMHIICNGARHGISLGGANMIYDRPLFQRALAELKYLGLVKPTRKKTDHVAKAAWKGL